MKIRYVVRPFGTTDGAVAVMILALLTVVTSHSAQGQTFKSLYSFTGSPNGATPYGAPLVENKSGVLYGTTSAGGEFGLGTVYELSKSGETVLYSFTGTPDGSVPYAGLVMDTSGNLYGTTSAGGSYGYGTVFELNPTTRQETVLHSFYGQPDGLTPLSGLVMDNSGNLYGTTLAGGPSNDGTIYKVNIQTHQETLLYSFTGDPDGGWPVYGNLLMDASGNLYGTTFGGGSANLGTVWEFSATGEETVLHSFTGADGTQPDQSLAMDSEGNLYGITEIGGIGAGVAFKVNIQSKTETVLYTFSNLADGEIPTSGLVRDSQGNLYGTTAQSTNGDGTVFELTGTKETVLHRFHGSDGELPFRSPLLLDDGVLYGVTNLGGKDGQGTVFAIKP
jgi:uncharacterized repeat protein (TIGR03803 family)